MTLKTQDPLGKSLAAVSSLYYPAAVRGVVCSFLTLERLFTGVSVEQNFTVDPGFYF